MVIAVEDDSEGGGGMTVASADRREPDPLWQAPTRRTVSRRKILASTANPRNDERTRIQARRRAIGKSGGGRLN